MDLKQQKKYIWGFLKMLDFTFSCQIKLVIIFQKRNINKNVIIYFNITKKKLKKKKKKFFFIKNIILKRQTPTKKN